MTFIAAKPKTKKEVRDIRAEALKIANSIKVEAHTSADTKAIAIGIQRGMEQFLRQQSEKTRDLDRRVKKIKQLAANPPQTADATSAVNLQQPSRLPWILLASSWGIFLIVGAVFVFTRS